MKNLIYTFLSLFVAININAQTTFCVNFENAQVSEDLTLLQVDIILSGSEDFLLGSSNLQFSYNNTPLSNPMLVSHTLGALYGVTVTTVGTDASFNIEQFVPSLGTTVLASGLNVGTFTFDISDNDAFTDLNWTYNGLTTQTVVFKDLEQIFATNDDESCLIPLESVALPIKMKSFTAVPFENRDANLDWVTSSEVNASHFDVERSDDGVNFALIGRVEAIGNSSTDQDYKFSDREVNMERNDVVQYYRIKMVDIDGEYKYSGVRVVNFTRADIDFTINAFPNPTVSYVQLELTGLDNASTERPMLNVYSNTGELIRAEVLNSDLGKIDMSNLPSSLYHFIIDYKGQRYTEKIILIK